MNDSQPAPGLYDWQLDHLKRYLETDGADGHVFTRPGLAKPVLTLILTTVGRKSGKRYLNPLIYGESNGGYVVIGSKGGATNDPAWYRNILANGEAEVQILGEKFPVRVRTATGPERSTLWNLMADAFPSYASMQAASSREFPVVVFERNKGAKA